MFLDLRLDNSHRPLTGRCELLVARSTSMQSQPRDQDGTTLPYSETDVGSVLLSDTAIAALSEPLRNHHSSAAQPSELVSSAGSRLEVESLHGGAEGGRAHRSYDLPVGLKGCLCLCRGSTCPLKIDSEPATFATDALLPRNLCVLVQLAGRAVLSPQERKLRAMEQASQPSWTKVSALYRQQAWPSSDQMRSRNTKQAVYILSSAQRM